MNDSYAECLVRRKIPMYSNVVNIIMGAVTAVCVLLALSTNVIGMILLFVSGGITYLLYRNSRVEYEYLYVDKILSVDKILGRVKRKSAWEGKWTTFRSLLRQVLMCLMSTNSPEPRFWIFPPVFPVQRPTLR